MPEFFNMIPIQIQMVIAGGIIDTIVSGLASVLNTLLTTLMYGVLIAVEYLAGWIIVPIATVVYYAIGPLVVGMAKFISGEFMSSLYSDALMVSGGGVMTNALRGLSAAVGDISNILIIYGVIFTTIFFLLDLFDKSARSELDLLVFSKSLIIFVGVVSLISNAPTLAASVVEITGDITKSMFEKTNAAVGSGTKIVTDENGNYVISKNDEGATLSAKLANGIARFKIANDNGTFNANMLDAYFDLGKEAANSMFNSDNMDENLKKVLTTMAAVLTTAASPASGTLYLAVALVGILIPFLVIFFIDIFCLSVFITRAIQLVIYTVFMPIAITDIYHNGVLGSPGMKYVKKFAAIGLQGIVLYTSLILAQLFIASVGANIFESNAYTAFGVFGGIGNTLLFIIVAVATAFTSLSLALKSQQIANDIIS